MIAAELQRRRIPFLLATGYGEQPRHHWNDSLTISKPFTEDRLLDTLSQLLASPV